MSVRSWVTVAALVGVLLGLLVVADGCVRDPDPPGGDGEIFDALPFAGHGPSSRP
ncbi:hypothetical protein PJ985_20445 [Streptomyces sp. ACA25]|uniref:hypothetical protein n=1 Tax=Streptomyces sp. ACA25 TaxID=3022596 RepID=UPI0023077972|nr:hypothetical protein [Streptomyces sp. ACA25]MDB1089931.1 hypothetical protein [Streptomyces sp. ACA25]